MQLPADRQWATRWVADGRKSRRSFSPILNEAVGAVQNEKAHVAVAIDLTGVFSPGEIRPELEHMTSLKGQRGDRKEVAELLADVKGVVLALDIDDDVRGTLVARFGQPVAPIRSVARPLLMEVMAAAGASLDELEGWEPTVDAKSISLEGAMTDSGLRRIGTIIELPAPHVDVPTEGATSSGASTEPDSMAAASQKHFTAVDAYLDDVRKARNSKRFGDAAVWIERYARKIDQLSILNVDPELQDYSAYVSARLHDLVDRLRGVQTRSAKRMAKHSNFYDRQASPWGEDQTTHYENYYGSGEYRHRPVYRDSRRETVARYHGRYLEGEKKEVRMEERAAGKEDARAIMNHIDQATSQVRRAMTNRYQVEF